MPADCRTDRLGGVGNDQKNRNRKEDGRKCAGEKNSGFSQILEELLREIEPVEYGPVRKCEVLEYALDKARTELMEGGFESAEVEGTVEFDSDLANSFLGGPVEKHFR